MKRGCPTGAAMPLCWSHAEYISLVRSRHDGVCLDRVEPAFQRYVLHPVQSKYEIWTLRYPLRRVSRGKILRIILAAQATVVWSTDGGPRTNLLDTIHESRLNLWFADFPHRRLAGRFSAQHLHSFGNMISVGKAVTGR